MNYQKIHDDIIQNAKIQNRKKYNGSYYEWHHIIPDFMFKQRSRSGPCGHIDGNPNEKSNLVLLTPKEHFLCHLLLTKIHSEGSRYNIQCKSSLIFFFSDLAEHQHIRLTELKLNSNLYSNLRIECSTAIGDMNRRKMPAKDKITGVSVGQVSTNHPKVLSGEWVHATKGRVFSDQEIKFRKDKYSGKGNINYREMTPDHKIRLYRCLERSVEENHFKRSLFELEIKQEFNEFKRISCCWVENNFGSLREFVDSYNKDRSTSIKYNRYHKSKRTLDLLRLSNKKGKSDDKNQKN